MDNGERIFCLILMAGFFIVGILVGMRISLSDHQTEAVKRGAAEWMVDADGTTHFRWKGD